MCSLWWNPLYSSYLKNTKTACNFDRVVINMIFLFNSLLLLIALTSLMCLCNFPWYLTTYFQDRSSRSLRNTFKGLIEPSSVKEWAEILTLSYYTSVTLIFFIISVSKSSTILIPSTIFFHGLRQKLHGQL